MTSLAGDPSSRSAIGSYRPDIDGLRSVAVLLVLVFHFKLFGAGKAGFIGVDVFFVISGFLISSIIWQQLEAGRFSLRAFYLRRFRRLAPALVCVQLMLLGFAYIYMLPIEAAALVKQSIFTQTYLINFYLWRSIDYFGLQADSVPLLHCWSLAVEEQFYLTYPLLLLGIHRYARRFFAPVLLVITLFSFALNVVMVRGHPAAAFYLLPTRAWELALGALLPRLQPWFASQRWGRQVAAMIGIGLLVAGVGLYDDRATFPGFFALFPTLGAAALLLAGMGKGSLGSWVLSRAPLVYLGKISYSLYLVHWPLRVFVESRVLEYSGRWGWGSFFLSLGLASLLFHGVEDPVRRGVVFSTGRQFVAAYALGFAGVMLLATSAAATGGWRHRFDTAVIHLADFENDQDDSTRHCEYSRNNWQSHLSACKLGSPSKPPEWLILGDSHAWALAGGFSAFLERRGEAGSLLFAHGCMPVLGLGEGTCQEFASSVLQYLTRDREIKTVVLVSIWRQVFEGESLLGPDATALRGDERIRVFHQQFRKTIQKLRASGKSVVIWESLPAAKRSVPRTLAWNRISGNPVDVSTTRQEHQRLFKFMTDAVSNNRAMLKGSIVPATTLCPTDACLLEAGGSPLYFDNNHPSRSSAGYFSNLIESQLVDRR